MDEWTTYAKENGIKSGGAYEHLFDCHVHDENGIATVTMSQAIEAVRIAENESK